MTLETLIKWRDAAEKRAEECEDRAEGIMADPEYKVFGDFGTGSPPEVAAFDWRQVARKEKMLAVQCELVMAVMLIGVGKR